MRIIDKNHDFYDYLQDSTDTLVFDRRGSFILTKQEVCAGLNYEMHYGNTSTYRFGLIQCGNTFWLLLFSISRGKNCNGINHIDNYSVELLHTWKNYNKENKLLQFDIIVFNGIYRLFNHSTKDIDINSVREHINDIAADIDNNNYKVMQELSRHFMYKEHKGKFIPERSNIPILKASGITNVIDPLDMFCAIEEYFSTEKTKLETTEPKGATNDDKIIMHGFDTKTSFRGKNK